MTIKHGKDMTPMDSPIHPAEPLKIKKYTGKAASGAAKASYKTNSATAPASFRIYEALEVFGPQFLDEDVCRRWIISSLHPHGALCPSCGLAVEPARSFFEGKRCHCGRCGQWFTATTNTFLRGTQLTYRQAFLLSVFLGIRSEYGLDIRLIAHVVGVSADTVSTWIKRFKAADK